MSYGWKDTGTVEEVDSPLAVQPEAGRERRRVLLDLAHALRQQAARADADTRTGVPTTSIATDAVAVMRYVAGQLVALARE
jgi:hypothetical protein